SHGDDRAAKAHPIVKHEMNHPVLVEPAQVICGHSKELHILRQELSAGRLKQRKEARQNQRQSSELQQRPTVADQCLEKSARFFGTFPHGFEATFERPLKSQHDCLNSCRLKIGIKTLRQLWPVMV